MKLTQLLLLVFAGLMTADVSFDPALAHSPVKSDADILVAQGQTNHNPPTNRPSSGRQTRGRVLTKGQMKAQLQEFQQSQTCQFKGQPKSRIRNGIKQTLLNCVSYKFGIVSNQSQPTTAVMMSRFPVLVAQKGDQYKIEFSQQAKMIAPRQLIVWTQQGSSEFAAEYTSDVRAKIVTEKFNHHFIQQGNLKVPPLSMGKVNNQTVVCAAPQSRCNENNILWTLRKRNQHSTIVSQLESVLRGDASALIYESEDNLDRYRGTANSVDISALIDQIIDEELQKVDFESDDDFASNAFENNAFGSNDGFPDGFESDDDWEAFESDDDWDQF